MGNAMKLPRRKFLLVGAGAAALPATLRVAWAQAYPIRPVHLIVGFPPGGPSDIVARLIGQWLSERLGQQFVIENRPGASTNIATEAVVRAPADGYTLLLVLPSAAINATLYDNLHFNFIRDITPVARMSYVRLTCWWSIQLFQRTRFPNSLPTSKPIRASSTWPRPALGHRIHVFGELFKMMAGLSMLHVPFRGAAPALTDLLGGQVQVMFEAVPSVVAHVQAGRLRALAVTTATRVNALPDVPPMADFLPGYEASYWAGIGVPKKTSSEIIDRLSREINAVSPIPRSRSGSMPWAAFQCR